MFTDYCHGVMSWTNDLDGDAYGRSILNLDTTPTSTIVKITCSNKAQNQWLPKEVLKSWTWFDNWKTKTTITKSFDLSKRKLRPVLKFNSLIVNDKVFPWQATSASHLAANFLMTSLLSRPYPTPCALNYKLGETFVVA